MHNGQGWLTEILKDAYLYARFHESIRDDLCGRTWERIVNRLLPTSSVELRQGPGQCLVFGLPSHSGWRHEIDGAATYRDQALVVESKALRSSALDKSQVLTFDRKTFDYYVSLRRAGRESILHRAMISAYPVSEEIYRYSYVYGLQIVSPDYLPLPYLRRVLGGPNSGERFSKVQLNEFERLAAKACGTLEEIFRPNKRCLIFDMDRFGSNEVDDLLWLHQELSNDVIEFADDRFPGYFEDRFESLVNERPF